MLGALLSVLSASIFWFVRYGTADLFADTQQAFVQTTESDFATGLQERTQLTGSGESASLVSGISPDETRYMRKITVHNPNTSDLEEYQVLVEGIDTFSLIQEGKMQSRCEDMRFTDSENNTLAYWIVPGSCSTENTRVWVKTVSLPKESSVSLYLFYGNASALSAQNEAETFSYGEPKTVGYMLSHISQRYEYKVMSMIDDNVIEVGSASLEQDAMDRTYIPEGEVSFGDSIRAKGLIEMQGVGDLYQQDVENFVPVGFAGTQFLNLERSTRATHYYSIVSPWGEAQYTVYRNGSMVSEGTATSEAQALSYETESGLNVVRIESTLPILVYYLYVDLGNGATIGDTKPLYPVVSEYLYGVPSTLYVASGEEGASVSWIDSDGQAGSATLGPNGPAVPGGFGGQARGPAVRVSFDNPVGASHVADADGAESVALLPRSEMGTVFGGFDVTQFVAISAPEPNTTCTLYDQDGVQVDEQHGGSRTDVNKIFFTADTSLNYGSLVGEAWRMECDKPVYAFFEAEGDILPLSGEPNDETHSWTYAQMRQFVYPTPNVSEVGVEMPSGGTYTTSPQDLIYLSSFGDGTDSSTAFLANVSDLSPDATITFSLRASDTQENLLTTPFTEIGTASSDGAFTKTKAQFDALGIPTGSAGRFIQIKADFSVSDQAFTPTLDDLTLLYMADDTPPETNASNLQMKKHLTGEEVAQGDWTNHLSPYFSWDPGTDSQSSLKGYCLYLGTDPSGNPETAKGLLGTSPLDTTGTTCQFITDQTTLDFANTALRGNPWITSSPNPYFVSIKAIDLAGNITDTATTFSFRFDNTPPTPPKYISLPSDFVSTKDITILWVASGGDAPQDNDSAIAGLQYRLGNTPWYGENHTGTQDATDLLVNDGAYTLHDPIDYENLAEGVTIVEMRAFDNAGNISTTTISGSIKLNTIAPSMPRDLSVTPQDAQTNEYTFFWSPPETFSGQENRLTYCYTVNTLPTMSTCTYTNPGTTNVPKDAYATQPGDNTFYVVAKDEAGNINYATRAEITFTYSGTAPGIPMGLDIADVSVKATESWKLALSWEEPENIGAGVAKYKIFRSQDNQTFSEVATATDISYVDTNLEQKEYFYKVKACDSANNCGAFSGVVSLYPDGKFTESAELSSQPEVVDITTKRATIKWTTKRGSDSRVQYGKKSGSYYDEEPSKSEQTTSHEINLTSLSAGTRYYYRAKWVDEDGNVGISEEKTFKTDPAPEVSETSIATLGIDTATITFTSKHADRLEVLYGESTSFGGRQEVSTGSDTSNHTVALQGLRDGTKYFYRIISYDVEEESYEGDIYSFTTLERPRIENVRLQQVRNAPEPTILVTWNSNTEISSIVTYQPEDGSAPSKDAVDVTLVAGEHRVILAPLEADKRYTLTVRGTDAFGNEAISDAQTFTTATDTRPPQISSLTVEGSNVRVAESDSPTSSQLSVSWNTDEPSTSQVEFGEGTGTTYTQKTQEDANLTTNHLVIVSGLTPSKVYHLRALSKDQAGNLSSSIDTVTITPKATESAFNLVLMNLKEIFGLL